jgi:hypothetical protein|tara:strand:+ start:307 stop:432 length:126 start_codon:yes stop_codon:yes gene_type:complete
MKKVSRAAKLGKQFKKLEGIMLIVIPSYFIGRILMTVIFDI